MRDKDWRFNADSANELRTNDRHLLLQIPRLCDDLPGNKFAAQNIVEYFAKISHRHIFEKTKSTTSQSQDSSGSSNNHSIDLDSRLVMDSCLRLQLHPTKPSYRPRSLVICISRIFAFEKWQLFMTAMEIYRSDPFHYCPIGIGI